MHTSVAENKLRRIYRELKVRRPKNSVLYDASMYSQPAGAKKARIVLVLVITIKKGTNDGSGGADGRSGRYFIR